MKKQQYAVYEKEPGHGKDKNVVILAPFITHNGCRYIQLNTKLKFIKNLFKRHKQLNVSVVSGRSEQLFCPNCGKSEIRENFWDDTKLVCNDCWNCWTK